MKSLKALIQIFGYVVVIHYTLKLIVFPMMDLLKAFVNR